MQVASLEVDIDNQMRVATYMPRYDGRKVVSVTVSPMPRFTKGTSSPPIIPVTEFISNPMQQRDSLKLIPIDRYGPRAKWLV